MQVRKKSIRRSPEICQPITISLAIYTYCIEACRNEKAVLLQIDFSPSFCRRYQLYGLKRQGPDISTSNMLHERPVSYVISANELNRRYKRQPYIPAREIYRGKKTRSTRITSAREPRELTAARGNLGMDIFLLAISHLRTIFCPAAREKRRKRAREKGDKGIDGPFMPRRRARQFDSHP